MKTNTLVEIIALLFIVLFVYAGISKLLEYDHFVTQIGQSSLLTPMAAFLAWFIPFVELVIALLLVLPVTQRIGLYASFTLMLLFTIYIILASRFSDYVPCSCGGVIQNLSWNQHLVFNLVFLLSGAAGVVLFERGHHGDVPSTL